MLTEIERIKTAIETATGKFARTTPNGWQAHCPAHNDEHASLSIGTGEDGRVLLHCQAGCEPAAILRALGLEWCDVFPDKSKKPTTEPRRIVVTYDYTDASGKMLFQVVRFAPKSFAQRRPDGKGGWAWNRDGVEPVLYRLPRVLQTVANGGRIFIVEGEKDVAALEGAGLIATCNVGGAGKWRREYGETLRGARIAVLPDNDEPGRKHAADVARSLHGIAAEVRVVELPGLPEKGDVTGWLANGGTPEKLLELIEAAAVFAPKAGGERKKKTAAPPLTDSGNAERLAARYGDQIGFCKVWGKWLVCDGKRWTEDRTRELGRLAKAVAREIPAELEGVKDSDKIKAILRWAANSENDAKIKAMLSRAEAELPFVPEQFDPPETSYLLNVENGTVDLRTGELHPHDRGQRITRLAPVVFDPFATCPLWEKFLLRIMDNNRDLIDFLQRAVGLSLIGELLERILLICFGIGGNGKSIFRETSTDLLGDYALSAPISTFMEKRGDSIPNDLARLKGVRFVAASESEQGQRLAPATIKAVTGGDTVSARFLHAEWFDFRPVFTPWLCTNHKPNIPDGGDKALWDRIRLIPFEVEISEEERIANATFLAMLREEWPGILQWMIRGCLEYQAEGLRPPNEVMAATKVYRDEQDTLSDFLEQCCVLETLREVGKTDLYNAYKRWAEDQGDRPMSGNAFGRRMANRGVDSSRQATRRFWIGIGLRE